MRKFFNETGITMLDGQIRAISSKSVNGKFKHRVYGSKIGVVSDLEALPSVSESNKQNRVN